MQDNNSSYLNGHAPPLLIVVECEVAGARLQATDDLGRRFVEFDRDLQIFDSATELLKVRMRLGNGKMRDVVRADNAQHKIDDAA